MKATIIPATLTTPTARHIFTGESAFADFTDLNTNAHFRVQTHSNLDHLAVVANPFSNHSTRYLCQCNLSRSIATTVSQRVCKEERCLCAARVKYSKAELDRRAAMPNDPRRLRRHLEHPPSRSLLLFSKKARGISKNPL